MLWQRILYLFDGRLVVWGWVDWLLLLVLVLVRICCWFRFVAVELDYFEGFDDNIRRYEWWYIFQGLRRISRLWKRYDHVSIQIAWRLLLAVNIWFKIWCLKLQFWIANCRRLLFITLTHHKIFVLGWCRLPVAHSLLSFLHGNLSFHMPYFLCQSIIFIIFSLGFFLFLFFLFLQSCPGILLCFQTSFACSFCGFGGFRLLWLLLAILDITFGGVVTFCWHICLLTWRLQSSPILASW